MQPERGVFEVRGQLEGYEEGKFFVTYVWNNPDTLNRIEEAANGLMLAELSIRFAGGFMSRRVELITAYRPGRQFETPT